MFRSRFSNIRLQNCDPYFVVFLILTRSLSLDGTAIFSTVRQQQKAVEDVRFKSAPASFSIIKWRKKLYVLPVDYALPAVGQIRMS
jgi:hypothetical protein